ncbi:hypothetical protein D9756_004528 [Leucocoprinus leucothites]|uniref:Uncharacterized protein n=1 Tax=Leucocoprinus leucothites TaxID=201217 RepID=A0A8H5LKJ7_9AGAR|nr:hypothetical protein D9756_004528 [Leucoagaricus leucothites]
MSSTSSSPPFTQAQVEEYRQSTPWAFPVNIEDDVDMGEMVHSTPNGSAVRVGGSPVFARSSASVGVLSPQMPVGDVGVGVDRPVSGSSAGTATARSSRRSGRSGRSGRSRPPVDMEAERMEEEVRRQGSWEYSHHTTSQHGGDASASRSHSRHHSAPTGSSSVMSFAPGDRMSISTVSPERASDYAKMSMSSATPPPSDVPISTYMKRVVDLVKKVHKMPWYAGERCTVDYYPGKKGKKSGRGGGDEDSLYDRRVGHVTAVSWKSREYALWRQSHYGHVGRVGDEEEEDEGESYYDGEGRVGEEEEEGRRSESMDSATGVIEPFPFIDNNNNVQHV